MAKSAQRRKQHGVWASKWGGIQHQWVRGLTPRTCLICGDFRSAEQHIGAPKKPRRQGPKQPFAGDDTSIPLQERFRIEQKRLDAEEKEHRRRIALMLAMKGKKPQV